MIWILFLSKELLLCCCHIQVTSNFSYEFLINWIFDIILLDFPPKMFFNFEGDHMTPMSDGAVLKQNKLRKLRQEMIQV